MFGFLRTTIVGCAFACRKSGSESQFPGHNDELSRNHDYIAAEALEPVSSARTVRVRHGKTSVTDGPFAEAKEQVGGFILVEAANMNQALEIAAGIPLAKLGSIEVRSIM
jgi:hypothetical protein